MLERCWMDFSHAPGRNVEVSNLLFNMKYVRHLECMICGTQYSPDEVEYICPLHGDDGILDVIYNYELMGRHVQRASMNEGPVSSMWRYRQLMPLRDKSELPVLRVGGTPLYRADQLAQSIGIRHVYIKDEGLQPTASFKDRASALAVVKAKEAGRDIVATASTGNAASALSGFCASTGITSVIFVPDNAPAAKVAQILAFGSKVLLIKGSYDDAFNLCLDASKHYGWYNRNTAYNPYMSEGKKTVSYEIAEQLKWQSPDVIFVSVGDGCIIGGVYKGWKDMLALGWVEKIPRIIGVQAEGSSYLTEAWEGREDVNTKPAISPQTVADSISVGLPRDRLKAMRAVHESGGAFIRVSDTEILKAIPWVASMSGVFAEPAGATAFAGLKKAVLHELVSPDDRIVVINTGSGLKDIPSVQKGVELAGSFMKHIEPDLQALETVWNLGSQTSEMGF